MTILPRPTEKINIVSPGDLPVTIDLHLAAEVGLKKFIFLTKLHDLIQINGRVFDGRQWVRVSIKGWLLMMPIFDDAGLRKRVIKPLVDEGLISTTRQYNTENLDKTLWYSISSEGYRAMTIRSGHNDRMDSGRVNAFYVYDQYDATATGG